MKTISVILQYLVSASFFSAIGYGGSNVNVFGAFAGFAFGFVIMRLIHNHREYCMMRIIEIKDKAYQDYIKDMEDVKKDY